ncbi:hypothetical protein ACFYY9_26430 [Streptomyces nigra]|uniref:hypothetical protein n=1 Tax=Streptomyces nigra TaxID=1827580 RepID=UPI0036ACB605
MGQMNLLRIAAEYVTDGARHGSPSMLMRRLSQEHRVQIDFDVARRLFADLYGAGVTAPINLEKRAYPVLLERAKALAAVDAYVAAGKGLDWASLYECPQCCRVAPWTDGRTTASGDEVDEYWCQTCGAEVPLADCAQAELTAA